MKSVKRIVTLILALTLALTASSCSTPSWAVKSGDITVSSGLYLTYLYDAYYRVVNAQGQSADPFAEEVEDKDPTQWMKDTAMDSIKNLIACKNYLKELGHTLPAETEEQITATAKQTYAQRESFWKSVGIGQKSLEEYTRATAEQEALFKAIYGEGGPKEVSAAELEEFFHGNYYRFKFLNASLQSATEGETISDESKKVITDRLDGYVKALNDGTGGMDEFQKEETRIQNPDSSADAEEQETDEDTSQYVRKDDDSYELKILMTLEGLPEGKATAFEFNETYFVFYRLPIDDESANTHFDENKDSYLLDLKNDEYTKELEDRRGGLEIEVNDDAIRAFDPKKFWDVTNSSSAATSASSVVSVTMPDASEPESDAGSR